MMGCLLSRALLLAFGYAYPAYKCFKILETKTPRIDQLLFWCQYWIIVGFITALEPIGDVSLSCLPLYGEAKLAFFIYLWHLETKGAVDIYNRLFRGCLSKHETEIDLKLMEIKAVSMNIASFLWNKVIGYALIRLCDIRRGFSSHNHGQEKDKTTIGPQNRPEIHEGCDPLKGTRINVVDSDDSTALENNRGSVFRCLRQRMLCCTGIRS